MKRKRKTKNIDFLQYKYPILFLINFPILKELLDSRYDIEKNFDMYEKFLGPFFDILINKENLSLEDIDIKRYTPYENQFAKLFLKFAEKYKKEGQKEK